MFVAINLLLTMFNLALGFFNISNDASPYAIAANFFAAGLTAMATIAIAVNR